VIALACLADRIELFEFMMYLLLDTCGSINYT